MSIRKLEYERGCDQRWLSLSMIVEHLTGGRIDLAFNKERLDQFQISLGVELPLSVKYWLAFYEQLKNMECFSFRDDMELKWNEAFDALDVLVQAEGDVIWSIKKEDLSDEDPPISTYFLDYDSEDVEFFEHGVWSCSLSCFALDYFLTYCVPKGGAYAAKNDDLPLDDLIFENFGDLDIFLNEHSLIFINHNQLNWNNGQAKMLMNNPVGVGELTHLHKQIRDRAFLQMTSAPEPSHQSRLQKLMSIFMK